MTYLIFKALHLIAMVAWMAGLFYLPRLYVYHADVLAKGEADQLFQVMERRLLRIIMNPAMILVFVFGIAMLVMMPEKLQAGWVHIKLLLVLALAGFHGFLAKCRKDFAAGCNRHSGRFYRRINEIPTLLLIAIVLLAVLQPF